MAGLFGGAPSAPQVIQTPATVIPVAPYGPQLAPGQEYVGGPVNPPRPPAAGMTPEEEEEQRRRNSILGVDYLGGADAGSSGAADAGAGDSSGAADGSAY
jgi:hypothetical protein